MGELCEICEIINNELDNIIDRVTKEEIYKEPLTEIEDADELIESLNEE